MQQSSSATDTSMYRPAVVAGGYVYVSGQTGTDASDPTSGSDIQTQTRRVIDRLQRVLEDAGSSLGQAVAVNVYLAKGSDFDAMNAAYREKFADAPPTRTTIVADLPLQTLVQMSAVAVPKDTPRETLLPVGWQKSPRPYSYIVRAGDLVFFSGLLSRKPTNDQVVSGSVGMQVKTILDNAGALLKTVGLTYRDVVAARVYLTDETYFEGMNDEYRKYFSSEPPARATAVTSLVGSDAKVEITLVASTLAKQVIGPTISPSVPVSTAVRVGPRVFLSGVVGNTDENAKDLGAQTREVLARAQRSLELAGVSFGDVVDNTVFLTDVWQTQTVDKISGEFFTGPLPARTVFGAHMAARGSLIEMMMIAVK
jgi:2-iminobutanoate/2-iminopropanoate deaminase